MLGYVREKHLCYHFNFNYMKDITQERADLSRTA